jgi:LacI family transcriptional regulator
MVVPHMAGSFLPRLTQQISEVFRGAGYSLILASADGDAENEERESELHLGRQVDALLFCLREDASDIPQALRNSSAPVVLIGHRPARVNALSVGLREVEVGNIAATHMLDGRSRRIAYFRGWRTAVADLRYAGFREALRDAGIPIREEWMPELQANEDHFSAARDVTRKLLSSAPRPDAIVCSTDLAAAGTCIMLREAGISVPDQIQVIGVGNTREICEPFGLTSIDLAGGEVGRRAARMAIRLMQKTELASLRSTSVSPFVVKRASSRASAP